MTALIRRFLRDDSGSVVVGDWVFIATILVLGAIAGAAALHHAPVDEPDDAPAAAVPTHATPAVAEAPTALHGR